MELSGLPRGALRLAIACAFVSSAVRPLAARGVLRESSTPALTARLDSIMTRAIRDGATPGAALAIGHAEGEPEIHVYGRIDWSPSSAPVTANTLYDLASLTKVLATTPAAMLLVQEDRLDLDAPVGRYLDWWPGGGARARITVRQLLLHTSGLPAGDDLWRVPGDREARIRRIAEVRLVANPGEVTEYSDLGMILLGAVVESITHQRLDAFVQGRIFRPLAMADTRFLPLRAENGPPVPLDRIAPTEWADRRGHLQGDVDDYNAHVLDGVAGHAGLFSSVHDVAHFARVVLAATEGESTPFLDPALVRAFAAHRPDGGRALGWDGAGTSSWGRYFSPVSFGHNGYTGTSIWIDPARDVYVVLLTNRVNPSAANEKHLALRREISVAVRDESPVRLAMVGAQPAEASVFAAEVAAARTIFRAPLESLRRVAERLHASPRHAHAARRASARHRAALAGRHTTAGSKARLHTARTHRSGSGRSHSHTARKRGSGRR